MLSMSGYFFLFLWELSPRVRGDSSTLLIAHEMVMARHDHLVTNYLRVGIKPPT